MAIWNRLTSFVTGGAVATAAADAMAPEFEALKQTAWKNAPHRVLDPNAAAELRARETTDDVPGIDLEGVSLAGDSARHGVGSHRFNLLTELARTEPGMAELFVLRRRGQASGDREGISAREFRRLLRRQGYTAETITDLEELLAVRLTPAQIALGVVRSLLPDRGFLPVNLNTDGGKVPAYGVSAIDPVEEARANGIDRERLRIMVGEIGLPMALDASAQSVFRGIIDRADFNRAVLEGDTRPEWADAIFDHARQIPSVADYVNAHIRGWIDRAAMHEGAARHGMSAADVDLLYLRTGRPAAPGQMATAAARGIDGPDGVPMNRAQFLKGIAESDIRPEWGEMLWESRYLYPPLFQLTRLVQGGAISADTAREWAVKDRYPPEVVNALHAYWSQSATTPKESTTHPWRARAGAQLWATLHKAYLAADATDDDATLVFREIGVSQDSDDVILRRWKLERDLTRARLTAAQLKKAYTKATPNPLTNAPWTREEALAELLDRGWNTQDAHTFLDL